MPTDPKLLMQAIKQFRESLGLTQVQFAVKIGKSYSSVQRYETKEPPPPADLAKFALFAKESSHEDFYRRFAAAALEDISEDVVRLIRELHAEPKTKKSKTSAEAATESVVYPRRTGTK